MKPLLRPRFYSTELGIREKVFVAVLSSLDRLAQLGPVLNETLAPHVGRLGFFVEAKASGSSRVGVDSLPVVGFRDDRRDLLALHVVKYLADKLGTGYSFFFLVRDTTFVDGRRLAHLVERLGVTDHAYLGTPLDQDPASCSLDGGIVVSASVLSALAPMLHTCTDGPADVASRPSDDQIVGRCIGLALNLTCQQKLGGQHWRSFRLDAGADAGVDSGAASATDVDATGRVRALWTNSAQLRHAVTAYPSSDAGQLYLLHHLSAAAALDELERDVLRLERSVVDLAERTPRGVASVSWPVGLPPPVRVQSRFDVMRWDYFNASHVLLRHDLSVVEHLAGIHLQDVQEVVEGGVSRALLHHAGYTFVRLLDGYRRFDPTRGMDYLLHLLFIDPNGQQVRLRIEACRPIVAVEAVPMPYMTEAARVHLLLPVAGVDEAPAALRFVDDWGADAAPAKSGDVHLTLVVFHRPADAGADVLKELARHVQRHNGRKKDVRISTFQLPANYDPTVKPMDVMAVDLLAATQHLAPGSLVFLCRPHSMLHPELLNRVRINTISGWQVYSALPFAEFNPQVARPPPAAKGEEFRVATHLGFYDTTDTGHLSFYLADYLNARKTFELELPAVRSQKEVGADGTRSPYPSVLAMFAQSRQLHVLRAVDPQLRLRYHQRRCSSQATVCHQGAILSQGTRSQLAPLLSDLAA